MAVGWVQWAHRDRKPMYDLRAEVYSEPVSTAYRAFADAEPGWEAYAAQQGIASILAERDSRLDTALEKAGGWAVAAEDRDFRLWRSLSATAPIRGGTVMPALRRLRHIDVLGAAGTALLALLVGVSSLRFWEWRPGVPLSLDGDSPLVLTQLRDILVNGWFWRNDLIGYPLGQNGSFFPELNVIHIIGVKALGLFSSDPATVGAVYLLLGYPLIGAAAYLLARSQRLSPAASVVVGVLFAAAPGHAERFEHLWLASYWTLPPAIWVAIEVARGRTPWDREAPEAGATPAALDPDARGAHARRAQRRLLRGIHAHPPRGGIRAPRRSRPQPHVVAGRAGDVGVGRGRGRPTSHRRQDRHVG